MLICGGMKVERLRIPAICGSWATVLATALVACSASVATAQAHRQAGESASRRTNPVQDKTAQPPTVRPGDQVVQTAGYDDWCDCSDDYCTGDCLSCSNAVCRSDQWCDFLSQPIQLYAGYEATFVKPRFDSNVAFTVMEADGASFESFTDVQFDYDLEFTPRAFVGWRRQGGVGLRATWWQFDHEAAVAAANPPANGFGAITHPEFGSVDISTTIPTDVFSAATNLNAYTIDLEATNESRFGAWDVNVAGGVRYAFVEQSYLAQLRGDANVLRGSIDFRQSIKGIGPTISLGAYRPIASDAGFFCQARGSALLGDGESALAAVEDADLANPFATTLVSARDDLLSIGEVQLGFRWQAPYRRDRSFMPFLSIAFEGQVWEGAGSTASEAGAMGFWGFNTGVGMTW